MRRPVRLSGISCTSIGWGCGGSEQIRRSVVFRPAGLATSEVLTPHRAARAPSRCRRYPSETRISNMDKALPPSIRAIVARRIRTIDTRTLTQQIQGDRAFKKKLAQRVIPTRPTATTQWHKVLPTKKGADISRTTHKQASNRFQILQEEEHDTSEEVPSEVFYDGPPITIQEIMTKGKNTSMSPKEPFVLYKEIIPLSIPTTCPYTSVINNPTPKQETEMLDKLDAAFGRKKGTTASRQRASQPVPIRTNKTQVQYPKKQQNRPSPEVQAILDSAPRYMIARAIQEWLKDQEIRQQKERLSQAMRDMHSLQIPPPPRVTCEEIPEEPTKAKIQPPGRWAASNQKKRLIQAIKRRSLQKQSERPQTETP